MANRCFYLHDRLGSVRQVISYMTNGLVLNSYTYGPFGEMIAAECAETTDNPFKFTGQYYDFEIAQYYLRARQYDPQLMRFTGRDPAAGKLQEPMTLHKYLYCVNDPFNRTDPKGEFAITEGIIAMFAVGNGVIQGNINVSYGPEDMSDKAKFWVGFTAGVLQMEVGMHYTAWAGSAVGSAVMSAGNAAFSKNKDFFSVRTMIDIGVNTAIGFLRDSMDGGITGWDIWAVGLFGNVTNKAVQKLYDDPYGTYGK